MDISCDIIRDLLPLYAEDMVSKDSRTLVDDHLTCCNDCVKVLADIQKQQPIPVEMDAKPLNHVKKMILRRRTLSVMASVLTLVTLAAFVITFLFAPFQLTKEQALDDFYVRDDGAVVIDYSPAVIGRMLSGDGDNWRIYQYSTRYDTWKGMNRKSIEELFGSDGIVTEEERLRYEGIDIHYGTWISSDGKTISDAPIPGDEGCKVLHWESEKNWWYADPNGLGNHTLLHSAGKVWSAQYEFSPVYPIIFFGSIAVALVFYVVCKKCRKPWIKELSARLVILTTSAAVSTLFVSSGRIFTSTVGVIDQYWGWMIGTNTVFLTLTILFWRQLYLLNRQDRGM